MKYYLLTLDDKAVAIARIDKYKAVETIAGTLPKRSFIKGEPNTRTERNLTFTLIASEASSVTLQEWIDKINVKPRKKRVSITEDIKAQVIELKQRGFDAKGIAERTGLSVKSATRLVA